MKFLQALTLSELWPRMRSSGGSRLRLLLIHLLRHFRRAFAFATQLTFVFILTFPAMSRTSA
ncbi:MAG: hypothetical protein VCA73_19115 [Roseibacillus sp.]